MAASLRPACGCAVRSQLRVASPQTDCTAFEWMQVFGRLFRGNARGQELGNPEILGRSKYRGRNWA